MPTRTRSPITSPDLRTDVHEWIVGARLLRRDELFEMSARKIEKSARSQFFDFSLCLPHKGLKVISKRFYHPTAPGSHPTVG